MDYSKLDGAINLFATIIFFLVSAGFIIITFVIDHHWRKYTTSAMRLYAMRGTYIVISGILLFVMASSLLILYT